MAVYHVRLQRVAVRGGAELRIRSLRDNQQFADADGSASAAGICSASWSLFGQLWPSSLKLADLMQGWAIADRRILEVGCGLALASLVIHRRGGNVTATDSHPLAGPFLQANLRLNRLPDLRFRAGHWQRLDADLGRFDLIIGSDVLYERSHPEQLAGFIQRHAAARVDVLIVDPARGHRSAFRRALEPCGFRLRETHLDEPLSDGTRYRGRLLHYRRT